MCASKIIYFYQDLWKEEAYEYFQKWILAAKVPMETCFQLSLNKIWSNNRNGKY